MSIAKPAMGCAAWIGLTLLQLVIGVAMAVVAYLASDAAIAALMGPTSGGPAKVTAVVLFIVLLGAALLMFDGLLKQTPLRWLRFSNNPIWTAFPP